MVAREKKWVQIKIDKDLADDTKAVLNELGLNPTTAIDMFYKRIIASGALPPNASLNKEKGTNLRPLKVIEGTPVTEFKDAKEVVDWPNDPDEN